VLIRNRNPRNPNSTAVRTTQGNADLLTPTHSAGDENWQVETGITEELSAVSESLREADSG
jgi:hypothetical protein